MSLRKVNKTLSANTTLSHCHIVSEDRRRQVYHAEDTDLQRQVTLKVLLAEIADDEKRVRRFVSDAAVDARHWHLGSSTQLEAA